MSHGSAPRQQAAMTPPSRAHGHNSLGSQTSRHLGCCARFSAYRAFGSCVPEREAKKHRRSARGAILRREKRHQLSGLAPRARMSRVVAGSSSAL